MIAGVIWTDRATDDFEAIIEYIGQFDPTAASRLATRLRNAVNSLATFPNRGRRVGKFRRWSIVYPYVIRYRLTGASVEILRIYHGARNLRSPRPAYAIEQPAF